MLLYTRTLKKKFRKSSSHSAIFKHREQIITTIFGDGGVRVMFLLPCRTFFEIFAFKISINMIKKRRETLRWKSLLKMFVTKGQLTRLHDVEWIALLNLWQFHKGQTWSLKELNSGYLKVMTTFFRKAVSISWKSVWGGASQPHKTPYWYPRKKGNSDDSECSGWAFFPGAKDSFTRIRLRTNNTRPGISSAIGQRWIPLPP